MPSHDNPTAIRTGNVRDIIEVETPFQSWRPQEGRQASRRPSGPFDSDRWWRPEFEMNSIFALPSAAATTRIAWKRVYSKFNPNDESTSTCLLFRIIRLVVSGGSLLSSAKRVNGETTSVRRLMAVQERWRANRVGATFSFEIPDPCKGWKAFLAVYPLPSYC